MNIECPDTMLYHVQKVLDGEYDVPYRATKPIVLDIGANVGSFAAWAMHKWPDCHVHCYEPLPENFAFLKRNLGHLEPSRVSLNNFAVGNPELKNMFRGRSNCGEASFYELGEQSAEVVEVDSKPPSVLPKAQIMKIDTEGSEIEILNRLPRIDHDVIVLEYHSDDNRRRIDQLLADYVLVGGEIRCLHRGTLKYLHRRLYA